VLLVSDHPQEDSWDLPGGFLLFGESPNEGLRRELVEELNVDVSVGRLIDAQVDAYGADEEYSLNLFYEAEIISGTPKPSGEIKRIAWFQLSYLPTLRYKSTRAVLNALQPLHTD
jgi:ADP-ribose pyrophosphatase YjhB (NUDIX family)